MPSSLRWKGRKSFGVKVLILQDAVKYWVKEAGKARQRSSRLLLVGVSKITHTEAISVIKTIPPDHSMLHTHYQGRAYIRLPWPRLFPFWEEMEEAESKPRVIS